MEGSELIPLRATYERIKTVRPDWPVTFEAAIEDALILAVLRTFVQHPGALTITLEKLNRYAPPRDLSTIANTQPAQLDAARDTRPAARFLDWKSRAAGERDED